MIYDSQPPAPCRRRDARRAVQAMAAEQDGVVSRAQARDLGADRWVVRGEVQAGRWRAVGRRTVAVHLQPLGERAAWRASLHEAGVGAALDGVSSLRASGLVRFEDVIHLSVPPGSRARSRPGVIVHQLRSYSTDDVIAAGIPRTRPHVAAIRAAMWARSDRAAATIMAMTVQQRLTTPARLQAQALAMGRHKRRTLILTIARDIADGAQALSELDFSRLCRQRGLPPPDRQVIRRGPRGRVYLDCYWVGFRLVVEIEGIHHDAPENAVDDSLRQNALSIRDNVVLRIPVIGIRTCPDEFMDQVAEALTAAGWCGAA
ncbi:MAG TPA: hypothetical protein VFO98_09490 [Marmoricola sp.]|nr:hypothetical protein [Marmoricola sp.]